MQYDYAVLLRSVLVLAVSVGTAYACDCREPKDKRPFRDHSEVIFRGKIIELRDSQKPAGFGPGMVYDLKEMVVFRVSRVWKGDIGQIFEMPALEETSMCIGFWPDYLKLGADLLVYANRSENSEYFTGICGGHKLAKDGRRDFRMLGPGKSPRPPNAQDSK